MIKNTESRRAQAHKLRMSGMSWLEVGQKLKCTADAARAMCRYHTGQQSCQESAERRGAQKSALDTVAADYKLSAIELKTLLASSKLRPTPAANLHKFSTQKTRKMRFGVLSDTHIGHEKFNEALFAKAAKAFKSVDAILHPGDHLEGMSGRPGHVYELAQIGYQAQFARAVELYGLFDGKPMYGIDGNHDQWFKAKGDIGVIVGQNLQSTLKNYHHLGEWEGDLKIDGLHIRLFHANDGTAYANSYKGQQLVNSLTGGEKPHVIFQGHYHKSLYQFTRNVHMFDAGTVCGQTQFMRGKKLAAHMGFWTVEIEWGAKGIESLAQKFTPGYE